MRALIAGTGSIGRRHIATLRHLDPATELLVVRRNARTDQLTQELGARVFSSMAEALAMGPDLAVVATPSSLHFHPLLAALRAGVPCYVEKPVVTCASHADALDRPEFCAVPTQTGCVLRFLPAVATLKAWLDAGRAGQPVRASFEVGQYLPDWRPDQDYRQSYSADPARGGGVVFDLIHELDLALHLFRECTLVSAQAAHNSRLDIASEDTALLSLRSPAGVLVGIALDYVSRAPVRTIRIVGDEATLLLDFSGKRLQLIGPGGVIDESREGFDTGAAYVAAMRELIEAGRGGAPTRLPLHEGLRATRLAIKARAMAGLAAVPA